MRTGTRINVIVISLSGVAFAAWEWHRISSFLASPDPSDVYDKTWSFQLMVAGIFHVPVFIAAMAAFLFLASLFMCGKKAAKPQ